MQISTEYKGNLRFQGGQACRSITIDAKSMIGGLEEANNPKALVLYGLAGCIGISMAALMKKQQIDCRFFKITVNAEETSDHPHVFSKIHINFMLGCDQNKRALLEKIIHESEKKYCGVSVMLSKTAAITWTLDIQD